MHFLNVRLFYYFENCTRYKSKWSYHNSTPTRDVEEEEEEKKTRAERKRNVNRNNPYEYSNENCSCNHKFTAKNCKTWQVFYLSNGFSAQI